MHSLTASRVAGGACSSKITRRKAREKDMPSGLPLQFRLPGEEETGGEGKESNYSLHHGTSLGRGDRPRLFFLAKRATLQEQITLLRRRANPVASQSRVRGRQHGGHGREKGKHPRPLDILFLGCSIWHLGSRIRRRVRGVLFRRMFNTTAIDPRTYARQEDSTGGARRGQVKGLIRTERGEKGGGGGRERREAVYVCADVQYDQP
eukprot:482968-Rhodomonas_salina.1